MQKPEEPEQVEQLEKPVRTTGQPVNRRGMVNINLNNLDLEKIMGSDQIKKLKNLLEARGILPTPTPTTDDDDNSVDDSDNGKIVKYTRQQVEDLYKKNTNNSSDKGNDGGDYFGKLFFTFQLYIAFINALMNAASKSVSMIFDNQPLQNVFSMFLVNALNIILKTNVSNLTPEQLRDLLEKNRPVLRQIAAIIIDEASKLLVGLSEVLKKLAMDWIENIFPGLVKSAAISIPNAVEAAIPPLGELVEIITFIVGILGSFVKMVDALLKNYNYVSEGYRHVKEALDSLQKIKDLLSQSPRKIIESATTAAFNPVATKMAQIAQTGINQVLTPNEYLKPSAPPEETEEELRLGSAPRLEDLQDSQTPLGPSAPPLDEDDSQPSESSIRNLANKIKEKFNDIKKLLKDTFGINISGPSELAQKIRTNSTLAVYLAKRFGMAVTNLQSNMITRLANELSSGNPDEVSEKVLRPIAKGLKDVSKDFDKSSQSIYKTDYFNQGSNSGGVSGGGSRRRRQATTRRKYLKDPKQFNRYISKLRKKTAKKELELLKSIQEIKNM